MGDSDYARFHSLNDLAHEICLATDTRLLGIGGLSEWSKGDFTLNSASKLFETDL